MTSPAHLPGTPVVPLPDKTLLTSGEVAAAFHVNVRTVHRWGDKGRLTEVRTPAGQRLYQRAEVAALLTPRGRP